MLYKNKEFKDEMLSNQREKQLNRCYDICQESLFPVVSNLRSNTFVISFGKFFFFVNLPDQQVLGNNKRDFLYRPVPRLSPSTPKTS